MKTPKAILRLSSTRLWKARSSAAPTTFDSIKEYEKRIYYGGQWQAQYDRWAEMLAGMFTGPGGETVSQVQARIFDMAFTQPVVHEFERVRSPTTLMIGQLDRTALAANRAVPDVAKTLGNYPELGREAARRIPNARLIEFPTLATRHKFRLRTSFMLRY